MRTAIDPKFTLGDLMILIAATAFGLGCYVLLDNLLFGGQRYLFGLLEAPSGWNLGRALERVAGLLAAMLPMFGGWTFALPIMVARRPRPLRIRSYRGPGLSACAAALAGMATCGVVVVLGLGLRWANSGSTSPSPTYSIPALIFDDLIIYSGVAVFAVWVVHLTTGRWRPRPNAIDRIGRFLGGLWIAASLACATRQFLH